jgi:hypothetical protein
MGSTSKCPAPLSSAHSALIMRRWGRMLLAWRSLGECSSCWRMLVCTFCLWRRGSEIFFVGYSGTRYAVFTSLQCFCIGYVSIYLEYGTTCMHWGRRYISSGVRIALIRLPIKSIHMCSQRLSPFSEMYLSFALLGRAHISVKASEIAAEHSPHKHLLSQAPLSARIVSMVERRAPSRSTFLGVIVPGERRARIGAFCPALPCCDSMQT